MARVNLTELRILIVDDSSTARSAVRMLLGEIGVYCVDSAADGTEAIVKLQEFAADLVICDLNMGPVDGIEFTKLVRNADDSPNPYVPIIMVTTEATKMQLRNAMAAGVNDFMVKPVDGVMLRRRIVAILSSPAVFVRESGHLRPQRWKPQPQPTAARGG